MRHQPGGLSSSGRLDATHCLHLQNIFRPANCLNPETVWLTCRFQAGDKTRLRRQFQGLMKFR